MDDVIIDKNKLGEAKLLAMNIEDSVSRTSAYSETLVSTTASSSSWEGESRDAFLSYIEIISKYHKELAAIVKLQTDALKSLEGYIEEFPQDGRVKRMKNI